MATFRGLCQSRGLLPLWDSNGCLISIFGAIGRKRTMDWHTKWCFCSMYSTFYHNRLHKLGKAGITSNLCILEEC